MNPVHQVTKAGYTLTHSWYTDDFGFAKNAIEVSYFKNGLKMIVPLWPPLRVTNYAKGTYVLGDDTSPYTEAEYDEMLNKAMKQHASR